MHVKTKVSTYQRFLCMFLTVVLIGLQFSSDIQAEGSSIEQDMNSIGGGIWFDQNGDGTSADNRSVLAEHPVYLYQADDTETAIDEIKTDSAGRYNFSGLGDGEYIIGVALEADGNEYRLSESGGSNFSVDPGGQAFSEVISVAAGTVIEELECILYRDEPEAGAEAGRDTAAVAEGIYTVTFMVAGEVHSTQMVSAGGTASIPDKEVEIPSGYVSFRGWYEDGSDEAFDFNTAITADITLHAKFDDKYLVRFIDGNGTVIYTQEVVPGALISEPPEAIRNSASGPEGTHFQYWYMKDDAEDGESEVGFPVAITQDTDIYAKFSDTYTVFFLSDGSQVENQTVAKGAKVTQPEEDPMRKGYTFSHWAIVDEDESIAFDFDTPITEDTYLIAIWTGDEDISYTVVFWMEKVGNAADQNPVVGNQSEYDAVKVVSGMTGTAGEMSDLSTADLSSYMTRDDNLRYAYIQEGGIINKTIVGDGSTIVNVYCARTAYTFIFDLNPSNISSNTSRVTVNMHFKGTDYTKDSDKYSFQAKYEQDISDLWVCYSTAEFSGSSGSGLITTNYHFTSWTADSGSSGNANGWTTKRTQLDSGMLSTDGQQTSYTLKANWTTSGSTKTVAYLVEALPDQIADNTITKYTYNGTQYVEMTELRDTVYSGNNIIAKSLAGLNVVTISGSGNNAVQYLTWNSNGTVGSGRNTFTLTPAENESPHRVFLYSRNSYTLNFNLNGDDDLEPVAGKTVLYGESLNAYEPSEADIPVWENHEFLGWYYDEEGNNPVDWDGATMPGSNLVLFAKWSSTEYKVYYYDNTESVNDGLVYTQGYGKEELISFPTTASDTNNISYTVGNSYEGKGMLEYWAYYSGGRLTRISESTQVSHVAGNDQTLKLYAKWKTNDFTITYNAGEGTGEVPVDSNTYALNTSARVLNGSELISNTDGYLFYAWQDSEGRIYYPGTVITICGDTTLTACYAAPGDLINVTYHSRIDGIDSITYKIRKNTNVALAADIFEVSGMKLLGWTTEPDGATVDYESGQEYEFGADDMDFYAVWEESLSTLTLEKKVIGSYADLSEEFEFLITLDDTAKSGIYDYTKHDSDNTGIETDTLTFVDGKAKVALKDGQSIVIELPSSFSGEVAETEDSRYTVTYTVMNTDEKLNQESGEFKLSGTDWDSSPIINAATITITNTHIPAIVDTNASQGMSSTGAMAMVAGAVILSFLMFLVSRKKRPYRQ